MHVLAMSDLHGQLTKVEESFDLKKKKKNARGTRV